MKTLKTILLTTLFFLYVPMLAAAPSEGEKLAELRGDVDVLESLLQKEREEARINRASLIQQRGELEMRLRQEEVRQKTIRALLKKRVSEQEVAKDWEAGLSEPTLQMASELKRYIQNGIPFKINERLQAVTQIEESIKKKDTSLPGGMARLWQIAEDEIRLSREVALHRQSIQLRGEYLLAEVVRVGMTLLYFKTNQGEYGMALQSGNTWSYEVLGRAEDQNALTTLFASLKKQIRKGYFSLPMPALNVAQRSAK